MAPRIQDPLLPQGSTILVTAANGFIASHIVDQLLNYGYAVRGTVRSLERSRWMSPLFESRHANSKLELVEIPDILANDCYEKAVKGVSAVVHTPAFNTLSDNFRAVTDSIKANLNILEAVAQENAAGGQIKRVVLISSSWAVVYPQPNVPLEVSSATYDTSAQAALDDQNTPKSARGLFIYVLSKVRSEQESWKWWKSHAGCGFVLNSVLPSTCIGPVLAPKDQEYPSTAGYVRMLYEGENTYFFDLLPPQWYIDVRDAARLHVAAAVLEGVEGERVFGWAETYTWPGIADVIEKEMGEKVPVVLEDKGVDKSTVAKGEREKAEGLLKRLGLPGWAPFDEAVRLNIRSYYPA